MNDVFNTIKLADSNHRIERSAVVLRMIQQTTECGWFIREYIKTDSIRALRFILLGIDLTPSAIREEGLGTLEI
jgi:hypothetical protein